MATIISRKRKGGTQFTARIRYTRGGKVVHDESETFTRRSLAKAWADKREAELQEPGALERLALSGVSIARVLQWYRDDYQEIKEFGRSKLAAIDQLIAREQFSKLDAMTLTSGQIISHVRKRRAEGAGPATVNNDLVWLKVAMRAARIGRDLPLPVSAVEDAAFICRKEGLISKSLSRERRPEVREIELLLEHFAERDCRGSIPMFDIVLFAIFSSRRQEEICRIRWEDLDEQKQRVLVRDMKHPRALVDTWVDLPERAWKILKSQKREDERIFPFNGKSISSAFTRSCSLLGIVDLRFHDLRHEAVSWCFETGMDIPHVAKISGHKAWTSLQRYTQIDQTGDKWSDLWADTKRRYERA